jgi:hypothetical protein
MLIPSAVARQHSAETTLLARFVAGDPAAADSLFRLLGSNDRASRESMMEVISNDADLLLWQWLLRYVALRRSLDCADGQAPAGLGALDRAYTTLLDLFLNEDDSPAVIQIKAAALSTGLTEPEPSIRYTAAMLLGRQGDARAVNVLIEAAGAGERDCQLRAIAALGQLRDERASAALAAALASEDEEVHWAASQALCVLKEAAFPALIQTLKAPKPHVRWHAARGLGDIGDARAAGSLAEALLDDDFSVRWAAAEALTKLGAPAVPEILHQIAQRVLTEEVCQAAYHTLHQLAPGVDQHRLQPLLDVLRSRQAPTEASPIADELLQTW